MIWAMLAGIFILLFVFFLNWLFWKDPNEMMSPYENEKWQDPPKNTKA